jgi:hypothetical protein
VFDVVPAFEECSSAKPFPCWVNAAVPSAESVAALYSLHLIDEQITKRLVHQLLKLATEHGLAAANRDSRRSANLGNDLRNNANSPLPDMQEK